MTEATKPAAPAAALLWSEDAERAVLAALIIERGDHRLGTEVGNVLEPGMFYRGAHRAIYEACQALRASDSVVDPLTLANALQAAGRLESSGGKEYIGGLLEEIPFSDHALDHARIVREYSRRRQLLDLAKQIGAQATDLGASIDAAYDWAGKALLERARTSATVGFEHVRPALRDALTRIEDRQAGRVPIGVSTGFPELDTALGGAPQAGQLVIIVGVPGCGKTSIVWDLLIDGAVHGRGAAGFVSAEMTMDMLAESALAARAGVRRSAITSGEITPHEGNRLVTAYTDMAASPVYFICEPRPRVEDILTRCRMLKQQQPSLSAIGVDFLQLIQKRDERRGELREQMYRDIAYDFQGLAIELGVVLYLLVQPNSKQIAGREGDKRPRLADVAGSQGPEEAATIALLLYRAKMYDPGASDELEIAVAKNKFGPSGGVARLIWEGQYVRAISPIRRDREIAERTARARPLSLGSNE